MKTIGIVTHSIEGGSLCFNAVCQCAAERLGEFTHPNIALSAVSMAYSMPGWRSGRHEDVAPHLRKGVEMVASAGADFFICPDNTAHIVLDPMVDSLGIPGLHIAHVVREEIVRNGWRTVGLLGTRWTMSGPVYPQVLTPGGVTILAPDEKEQEVLNSAIFDKLCKGIFDEPTTLLFEAAIRRLKDRGAECVILGCTEIPIIIQQRNSALPVLDSTRLLASYAVSAALDATTLPRSGWIAPR